MKKTFQGSCHCKRVKFEADVDFSAGTHKCNCTYCFKHRWWSVKVPPTSFRVLSGESELTGHVFGKTTPNEGFCKHCGVGMWRRVPKSDWNPLEYVSVGVSAFDDVPPADLVNAPTTYYDGLANNWWQTPAEVRHL